MNFLIIGLGSMGKRRVRNLQSLGISTITGFDPRSDRQAEAADKYQIKTIATVDDLNWDKVDALIVSTPPHLHNQYIKLAIAKAKPVFVEASVILEGLTELDVAAKKNNVLIAPSCTMRFHPAIKDIKMIVESGCYGAVTNFSFHSGQYLPDWHPWEKVSDYYVSNPSTGAAREIVPFELTWMVDLLGFPDQVKGIYGKTMDVGAPIDDTYALCLKYPHCIGSLIVDVVSRYATRSLILNLSEGQILWRWDKGAVNIFEVKSNRWIVYKQPSGKSAAGYNVNIIEDMYIEEMSRFIAAIKGDSQFPNSLADDIKVLEILHAAEKK